jgi:hypothetical protein
MWLTRHEKERNHHVTKCCIEPQIGTNFGRELTKHRPSGEVGWTYSRRAIREFYVHLVWKFERFSHNGRPRHRWKIYSEPMYFAFHMTGYPNIHAAFHDLYSRSLLYSIANQAFISSVDVVPSSCVMLYYVLSELFLHRQLVPHSTTQTTRLCQALYV